MRWKEIPLLVGQLLASYIHQVASSCIITNESHEPKVIIYGLPSIPSIVDIHIQSKTGYVVQITCRQRPHPRYPGGKARQFRSTAVAKFNDVHLAVVRLICKRSNWLVSNAQSVELLLTRFVRTESEARLP